MEIVSISDESSLKAINKGDVKYLIKFKKVSMRKFKEIFNQINATKKEIKEILFEIDLDHEKQKYLKE